MLSSANNTKELEQAKAPGDRATSAALVSIVIPCYKGAAFLAEAIESCLNQTYRNLEILVVDDACPENCTAIADRYAQQDPRIRVIRRPTNGRVARALNTGFEAARGQYFTRLAQDDLFAEDAIATMCGHLDEHPETGLVYCDYQAVDEQGNVLGRIEPLEPDRCLQFSNRLGLCVMWRRRVWETVGPFDPSYDTAEDYDYWLRVAEEHTISKCNGPAPFFFRQHPNMGSVRFISQQEDATLRLIHRRALRSTKTRLQRWLEERKALGWVSWRFATAYSGIGRHGDGLVRMIRSFYFWPLPYSFAEAKEVLVRPKLAALLCLRLLGLRNPKTMRMQPEALAK
jgi:glycosyltransferase involved in cell wall biosynthesis